MKARPILFSAPMVRALRAGTKTQTRRIVKGIPADWDLLEVLTPCPYGEPADLLWVRESCAANPVSGVPPIVYRADRTANVTGGIRWTPSIHMPRWGSRLTLRITDVRVERLQSISISDARAEGMEGEDPVASYRLLWEVINAPGSWTVNPFVWAISFDVIAQNVDQVAA
jgi:hypothetical protein